MALIPAKKYLSGIENLTSNPSLKKLAQEVSLEEISNNLTQITDECGARLMGSKGYEKAATIVVKQMKDYGFQDARLEAFGANLGNWDPRAT